jgi:hypothetical protein
MKNNLQLIGTYEFEIRDINGNIRDSWSVKNLVTTVGFAQLALLCGDTSAVPFTYIAVGTSSTAVAVGDTTLTAEITDSGLERAAGTVSRVTTTGANDTFQIVKTWTAIEEVGVFNDATAGTMLSHALTTSKAISSGETIQGTYKLKFA